MPGPAPGAGCAVCESPLASDINRALHSGLLSNRKIAARYGVSKDSIGNHVNRRHRGYVAPGERTGDRGVDVPPDGSTELDRLRLARRQLEDEMSKRPRPEISREIRELNRRVAELEGTDRVREATLGDVEGLREQLRRWADALEPFPDAREAMLAATDPSLLGEGQP